MKKSSRTALLIIVVVVLATAGIMGYYMYNKGPVNVNSASSIEATPAELYSSYITDSVSAQKKFDGQIVKLAGEVKEVSENSQKQQIILLKTSTEGGYINCTMEQAAKAVKAGDMVTVKGICSGIGQGDADLGILGDVYLTRSIIVN